MIIIQNSKPNEKNPKFRTTKTDRRMHGRGLRAVREVAELYGGNLLLQDDGETFKTSLLLTKVICLE